MTQREKIIYWLMGVLLWAVHLAYGADPTPPPPPVKIAGEPYRIGFSKNVERATLVPTNRFRCPTNCVPPISEITYWWDHYGPGPQFIYYEVDLATKMVGAVKTVLTTNTFYTLRNTNGQQMFVVDVRARDVALKNASKSLVK